METSKHVVSLNSNIKPMEAREVRPRFQHLMNHSPPQFVMQKYAEKLMDNGIDLIKFYIDFHDNHMVCHIF